VRGHLELIGFGGGGCAGGEAVDVQLGVTVAIGPQIPSTFDLLISAAM